MSMKKLLGLEKFPLEEEEILRRIGEASLKNREMVEFSYGKQKVKIRVKQIFPEGLMKEYEDYYIAH